MKVSKHPMNKVIVSKLQTVPYSGKKGKYFHPETVNV